MNSFIAAGLALALIVLVFVAPWIAAPIVFAFGIPVIGPELRQWYEVFTEGLSPFPADWVDDQE